MATYVTINYLDPPRSIKVTKDRDKDQDLGKDGKVNGNGKVFMSQRILKGKPALRRIQLERARRKSADCLIQDRTDLSKIDSCLIEPLPPSSISNHSSSLRTPPFFEVKGSQRIKGPRLPLFHDLYSTVLKF